MVTLTNGFGGGTSGTTISNSNSGGSSGNAFDVVSIGASSSLAFSSTEAAHGPLSALITEAASDNASTLEWSSSLTGSSLATVYFRAYFYFSSLPPVVVRFIQLYNGNTRCGSVGINANGKLALYDEANTLQQTFTTVANMGSWFRVEGYCTGNASAGVVSASLYNSADGTTATESHTVSGLNTTGAISNIRFGVQASVTSSCSFWMDDLGASDTALLGPAATVRSSAGLIVPSLIFSAPGWS